MLNKYLAKNRQQPPAIFQPVYECASSSTIAHYNMAYRHPSGVLMSDQAQDISNKERDRDIEVQLVDDNSVELLDTDDDIKGQNGGEPIIVPIRKHMTRFGSMHQRSRSVSRENSLKATSEEETSENKCRLVGRVNPNIVRTWEQLKGTVIRNECSITTSVCSENSTDKQSFTLFCRKPYNFKELEERLEKFPVRKVRHNENSGDFFDSIDDNNSELMYDENDEENIVEENDILVPAGREGMADFDSIERRRLCWSIDDDV